MLSTTSSKGLGSIGRRDEMAKNYWDGILTEKRLGRRRVVGVTAAGLTGAAILAACGGSDNGSGSSSAASSAPAPPVEKAVLGTYSPSDGSPKPGGRFSIVSSTVPNFNPVSGYGEGANLSGVFVFDRPLTSREDKRRYVLEA